MHDHHSSTTNIRLNWLLWLACLLPLAGLAAVLLFNVPVSNLILWALVLTCPLSHFFMMRHGGHSHANQPADPATAEQTEVLQRVSTP